jgi:hypothetical protein
MAVRQSDEADMATFRAAYPEHVEAELQFYAELDTQRQAAGAACLAAGGGPSNASNANIDNTEMDTDWWDDLTREVDAEDTANTAQEESDDGGF